MPWRQWVKNPSSLQGRATSVRLFRQASICVNTVVYSSKVSFTADSMRLRWCFTLFTQDSQRPPKCGERSGMNFHVIFCEVQNWETPPCVFWSSRKSNRCFKSFWAPTKLDPWSLHMSDGFPLRAMKRLKDASDVRSETNSRWIAFTDNDTNTQM